MFRKKELDHEQRLAKDMFSQMTRKEKTRYVLHYYGLHIFVAVALLIGAVVYVVEYQQNKARENWLYFVTPGNYCYDIQAAADLLVANAQWPEGLNHLVFADNESEVGIGNMQLLAYLTDDTLDFLVCDQPTLILLAEDETLKFDSVPLKQTALGQYVDFRRELFLVTFYDTARYEKVVAFRPILVPEGENGQSAQIQP